MKFSILLRIFGATTATLALVALLSACDLSRLLILPDTAAAEADTAMTAMEETDSETASSAVQPAESNSAETRPLETWPSESLPLETRPSETWSSETTSAEPSHVHMPISIPRVEPTCISAGLSEGLYCAECGETLVEQKPLSPARHSFAGTDTCILCGIRPTKGLQYGLNPEGDSYCLIGLGTATDTDIIITDVYNELPVTRIEQGAFRSCTGITSIVIPSGVTEIGDHAFWGCTGLTSITIPDSVRSIGGYAFDGCTNVRQTEAGVHYVNSWAVGYEDAAATVVLRDGTTGIADHSFYDFPELTSITIPDSVISIGHYTFSNCPGLTSIHIPDGVTYIGVATFRSCTKLSDMTIPDSVTVIDSSAFEYCSSLSSIVIPDSVTVIHSSAFKGCSALTSMDIPNSVTAIYNSAFSDCRSLKRVVIPDSVTVIGSKVFMDCPALTDITLPESITSIGDSTFENCRNLVRIAIPDSVTSIGMAAFRGCQSLTDIAIPDTVTSIGMQAFTLCTKIIQNENHVHYVGSWVVGYDAFATSITLRPGTKGISGYAFMQGYQLTHITIPADITNISARAFANCETLSDITFQGTMAQWTAIAKEPLWDFGTGKCTIHCTDGDIAKA